MVVHVSCHGSHSHFYQQFEDAVLQFAVFHTVHAWTMPHQQLAAAGINMLTGQRAQPPEGTDAAWAAAVSMGSYPAKHAQTLD